jgi:Tol biopolymer transport system component
MIVLVLALGLAAPVAPERATPGALTIDTLLEFRHPSRAAWSPDGLRVAFVWDRGGVQDVYLIAAAGGEPKALTHHTAGSVDGLFWSRDGRSVFFERSADLWQAPAAGDAEPRPVWSTPEAESDVAPSHDGTRVAFSRSGDLWVRSLADGRETRLTETPEAESGPVWSADDGRLAFSIVTSRTEDEFPDYVGFKIGFRRQTDLQAHVGVVAAGGGATSLLAKGDGGETAPGWLDARRLCLQRETVDLRSREVVVVDVVSGELRVAHRDDDAKFYSLTFLGAEPVASPDGRFVAFISDRDGWDHLYVAPAAGGPVRQLTRGRFEVSRPAWSPDGKRIAFVSNSRF